MRTHHADLKGCHPFIKRIVGITGDPVEVLWETVTVVSAKIVDITAFSRKG